MIAHGYATGHGDTVEDMLVELEAQAKERGGVEVESLRRVLMEFASFVAFYRRVYMDTQTRPTAGDEAQVMAKARALTEDFEQLMKKAAEAL
jgi:hypothetical protein